MEKISIIIKYSGQYSGDPQLRIGELYFRVRQAEKYQHFATGLRASKSVFNVKKKEFIPKSMQAIENNVKLRDQETEIWRKIMKGQPLHKRVEEKFEAEIGAITFQYIVKEYKRRAENGLLRVKKTGLQMSRFSVATVTSVMSIAQSYDVDFNFSKYNATSGLEGLDACNQFIGRLLSCMSELDPATQSHRCVKLKQAITTICKSRGIHLGEMLDELKVYAPEKPVLTIDKDQVRYMINNYHEIAENCSRVEKSALQYFVIGLMLLPRKTDMNEWEEANLYKSENALWIKYKQSKSKNTSPKWIDVPVPELAEFIFEENIRLFGKLMPPLSDRINIYIKDVGSRLDIFKKEIQVLDAGRVVMVPQWKTLIIHMGRASGLSDKLSNNIDMAYVKEWSGHTPGSKAVNRYVNMQKENMKGIEERYQQTIKQ